MPSQISGLLRKATRSSKDNLNILTFPTHERYQTGLSLCGHEWFLLGGQGIKTWDSRYAPVPSNHTILNSALGPNQILLDVDMDLILSQNRFAHFNIANELSRNINVPKVSVEHCVPGSHWTEVAKQKAREMSCDIDVFISDFSIRQWGIERQDKHRVIYHGIDTDSFSFVEGERPTPILNVCNKMRERPLEVGWELWVVANDMFGNKCKLVGDNPGVSEPAKTVQDLAKEYQSAKVFLNTTLVSTYPTSVLEAMACGAAVVTTKTCAIPEIITHGHNGLLFETIDEMKEQVNQLLNDEDMRKELAQNALQTIKTKFTMERFIKEWNDVLYEAANL